MTNSSDWRPVLAALGSAEARRVFARLVLGEPVDVATDDLPAGRRQRVLTALTTSGLIVGTGTGARINEGLFAAVLQAQAAPRPTGIDRFLDAYGKIDRYPANLRERGKLLGHVADQVLAEDDVVDEKEINARLARFSDDTAVLRRYLVDYGLVDRTPTGSRYARRK